MITELDCKHFLVGMNMDWILLKNTWFYLMNYTLRPWIFQVGLLLVGDLLDDLHTQRSKNDRNLLQRDLMAFVESLWILGRYFRGQVFFDEEAQLRADSLLTILGASPVWMRETFNILEALKERNRLGLLVA